MTGKTALAGLLIGLFTAFGCIGGQPGPPLAPAPYQMAIHAGDIQSPDVDESSGLAASRQSPGILWTINDSGNPAVVHALGENGEDRGQLTIKGAGNRDWEDLAIFRRKGTDFLLIADVGDNAGKHPYCSLYMVREPPVGPAGLPPEAEAPVAWRVRFRYEDGPRDCEAVAVDPGGETVILLTKRETPPALYTLPIAPSSRVRVARRIRTVTTIPAPTAADLRRDPVYGRYGSQPTGMDISPDGRHAVVLTYRTAYWFDRSPGETWAEAFGRPPGRIAIPPLAQAEGTCFGADGRTVFITSEKRPAPLLRIPPAADSSPARGDVPAKTRRSP